MAGASPAVAVTPAGTDASPWWVGYGGTGPIYSWTAAIGRPDALLKVRPIEASHAPRAAARSLRILYASTAGFGAKRRIATSGAIYVPAGSPPPGGWPMIAWAHRTVGIADICAPSFSGLSERDEAYLSGWLKQGYAVVAASRGR